MNYYDEIIIKIEKLIDLDNYKKSYDLITNELSMPYIPQKYEDTFKILRTTVSSHLLDSKKEIKTNFNKDTIFKILQLNNDPLAPIAITQLKDLNLQNSLNDIIKILKNPSLKNSIKVIIFEYMVEQNINMNIEIVTPYESKTITSEYSLIMSDHYKKLIDKIQVILNKNPSLLEISKSYVNQFIINAFPIIYTYEKDDEIIFVNIAESAMGNHALLSEKLKNKSIYINEILKRYI